VAKYDAAGTFVKSFTKSGSSLYPTIRQPQGVYVDAGDNVFVADTGNNMIEKFVPTTTKDGGKPAAIFTTGAPAQDGTPTLLNHPGALLLDGQGRLSVADTGHNQFVALGGTLLAPTGPLV